MDSTRVLVVDNGSLSAHLLCSRLADLGVDVGLVGSQEVPRVLPSGTRAMVLSGTGVPADEGSYRRLEDTVSRCAVPVLGVCGGMQILGVMQGGRLVRGVQRVGAHEVRVDASEQLFSSVPGTVSLFQRHTRYLTDVPEQFRVIGRSATCAVEFIRSRDGRLFGSQAHLEFRSDGISILRGFLDLALRW
ncbi:gamma-glutamyl-gamma-aminobutyrate hydrolase family protein [Streptomyces sp. NPDC101150]|uniref:glutamine amidotransferase-related protein n=1 Tax=Streptomyces sp. NPDC101150 TaxID=3366114 RepID=UPI00382F4855